MLQVVFLLMSLISASCNVTLQPVTCDYNIDCYPDGCCLALFVDDVNSTCQQLGLIGEHCDSALSVSETPEEGEDIHDSSKYLGHCPCGPGLACTQEHSHDHVGRCYFPVDIHLPTR